MYKSSKSGVIIRPRGLTATLRSILRSTDTRPLTVSDVFSSRTRPTKKFHKVGMYVQHFCVVVNKRWWGVGASRLGLHIAQSLHVALGSDGIGPESTSPIHEA